MRKEKNVWGSYKVNVLTSEGTRADGFVYAPNGWEAMAIFSEQLKRKLNIKVVSSGVSKHPVENVWQ